MKPLILVLLMAVFGQMLQAQSFATRFQLFSRSAPSFVDLQSGETLAGHLYKVKAKKGLFTRVTFTDTVKGETRILMASEIASMKLVPHKIARLGAVIEATQSFSRMENSDFDQLSTDFVYFQQATLTDKNNTPVLLQKINPGFDTKIQVYDDPRAKETKGLDVRGVEVTGGNLKSYYLIRNGKAVKIEKSTYKKEFAKIYGNCPELTKTFPDIDWLDFPEHVATHEKHCN